MDARELIEQALAVPSGPDACGRVVIVEESSEVALRWANNTMTTNGHSTSVRWTVVSLVEVDGGVGAGTVSSATLVSRGDQGAREIEAAVRAGEAAAVSAGPARDAAPLPERGDENNDGWNDPAGETGIAVFGPLATGLAETFRRASAERRTLYGFAHHQVSTTWLGTSTGIRRRWTQPTGSVELNAKAHGSSAWAGRAAATPDEFADLDIAGMDAELVGRLNWGKRRIDLPAGRYRTILPASAMADLMTYLCWEMSGRPAQEGHSAFAAPPEVPRATRIGERLTDLPLTLYSDPFAPDGLACAPFLSTAHSGDTTSVFDNGADLNRVDWVNGGVLGALAYPRAAAAEFGAEFTAPADNLVLDAGPGSDTTSLDDLIAGTDRGLLLTCLWYIRMVDPASLLLTGLTRDGVYLVERGEVVGEVNNFRFNESPLDLLRRVEAAGRAERTLPREFKDWFTRTIMPPVVVPDFNMSSVSQAS